MVIVLGIIIILLTFSVYTIINSDSLTLKSYQQKIISNFLKVGFIIFVIGITGTIIVNNVDINDRIITERYKITNYHIVDMLGRKVLKYNINGRKEEKFIYIDEFDNVEIHPTNNGILIVQYTPRRGVWFEVKERKLSVIVRGE